MDREEIRLRRLAGQRLIAPEDKLSAARSLCGVQAQFMSNALHALRIRCSGFDEGAAADGLVKTGPSAAPSTSLRRATCPSSSARRTTAKTSGAP